MSASSIRVHYTEQYLLDPQHRVTVDLVGLGGTGSRVLGALGDFNASLIALDHPGLYVRAWDPDVVTEFNVGRQAFSAAEVGQFKSVALITKMNRHFGTDWEARTVKYGCSPQEEASSARKGSNILITCVDTIAARFEIRKHVGDRRILDIVSNPAAKPYYWLDFGNAQRTGQVVLGTLQTIRQPQNVPEGHVAVGNLPDMLQMFPQLKTQKEDESGPSCSIAEALQKQDLFINRALSDLGMQLLWNLFRELRIQHHGLFLNLATLTSNPINV